MASLAIANNPDVRFLGRLLGDVIRAYGGEELFKRIEYIRATSVDRHRGVAGAGAIDSGLDRLSLDETLDFVRGFYPDWDEARCARLLTAFELARGQKIAALSFGARIKLALTMALAREAELLLLDEPTIGLDVNARRVLFHELLEVVKAENRAVVISSHQLSDLERLADHCAILANGRLAATAPMDGLLARYVQVDAVCAGRLPETPGARLIARNGDRVRLLLERARCDEAALAAQGVRVVAEVPLNLEDLFVALTAEPLEAAA